MKRRARASAHPATPADVAVDPRFPVAGQFVEPDPKLAPRDFDRAGDGPGGRFPMRPDVDHQRRLVGG